MVGVELPSVHHEKRKRIRYYPLMPETCELIRAPFETSLPRAALMHDESHSGCSILCVASEGPATGETVLLKGGKLGSIRARVTYILKPALDVQHIGCEFLDGPPALPGTEVEV